MSNDLPRLLSEALWKIYRRPERALPWTRGSDLFWRDPAFSERILREHLDDSHGAASRETSERLAQIEWLWNRLDMQPGSHLFDVTCGPGLYAVEFARRGCAVTGIDISPASIAYAKDLATIEGVASKCAFIEQDIKMMNFDGRNFDAALLLYGQLAVFPPAEAEQILAAIARSLKPGGYLGLELLNPENVDKTNSSWWFTDEEGLWGESPFFHLGERFWHAEQQVAVERYHIINLRSGELTEMYLTDQSYATEVMTEMLNRAGFDAVEIYPAWAGLPLEDAAEWLVYVARRSR
jgi:ubiquinone/menaquinone biosynthesis C-methylase UbiE